MTDEELKKSGYKYLGWMNAWGNWDNYPLEYKKCAESKHQKRETHRSHHGSDNTLYCDICRYYANYDSSD